MANALTQILTAAWKPFQWWVVIAPWERGLLVRLGKVARPLEPGPHFRIPFLDRVYVQSVRLRMISEDGQTMTTKDGKVMTLSLAVQFAVADLHQLYQAVANPEMTLLSKVQALVAEHVAATRSEDLVPASIEEHVASKLPTTEWGLGQVRVYVITFAFVRTYRLLMYQHRSLTGMDESSYEDSRNSVR